MPGKYFWIIVMFSSVAYATNSDFSPHVTGYIYDASNNPVSGANVTAACGSSTGSTTSMSSGFYSIDFDNSCVSGSGVNVSASLGSSSGTGTAIMVGSEGRGSVATASVNIELIKGINGSGIKYLNWNCSSYYRWRFILRNTKI